jgi:hypothetical protein
VGAGKAVIGGIGLVLDQMMAVPVAVDGLGG